MKYYMNVDIYANYEVKTSSQRTDLYLLLIQNNQKLI